MIRAGNPLPIKPQPSQYTMVVDPTIGFDSSMPAVNTPLGATPASDNFILRDGALEPRPMLSTFTATPQSCVGPILGAYELIDSVGNRMPVASGQTTHMVYGQPTGGNQWSVLSYVQANGVDDAPALTSDQYWDYAQVYSAENDDNFLYMFAGSYQTMYVHLSNTTLFSTMTGAPQAKYGTSLDNYVVTFNQRLAGADLVQRVQWNDRGSASSWTGGLSGLEDLLSMKGTGTRIVTQDNALFLFSDEEIWRGTGAGNDVFVWSFAPYDQTRGCPYPWTVAQTPLGTMFLGKDYQVYLLPKGGGLSQPVGQKLWQQIRTTIDRPERSWAYFDNTYGQYKLYYPIVQASSGTTVSGYPQRAAYLDVLNGRWMPQSFNSTAGGISLTRGAEVQLHSSTTSWGGLQASGRTWGGLQALSMTWQDLRGRATGNAVMVGSSKGTMYVEDSTATSDAGIAVQSKWRSGALLTDQMNGQKTVSEWRADYKAAATSAVTVQFSPDLGNSFISSGLSLTVASFGSQAIVYPYFGARFPMFEVTSEGARYRLHRFGMQYTEGGR